MMVTLARAQVSLFGMKRTREMWETRYSENSNCL